MRSERLCASLHTQPFETADQSNNDGGERRLHHARKEMVEADDLVKLVDIHRRFEPEHDPGHDAAADERGDVAHEGEQRQGHDKRGNPRYHKRVDRIDSERSHGCIGALGADDMHEAMAAIEATLGELGVASGQP